VHNILHEDVTKELLLLLFFFIYFILFIFLFFFIYYLKYIDLFMRSYVHFSRKRSLAICVKRKYMYVGDSVNHLFGILRVPSSPLDDRM
jgi:hypothetical protein